MNCWKSWLWRFWRESARNPDVADMEASVPMPPPPPPETPAPERRDESSDAPASESDTCIIEEPVAEAPTRADPGPDALGPAGIDGRAAGGEANTLGANTMARLLLDMFTRDACEATSRRKRSSARSRAKFSFASCARSDRYALISCASFLSSWNAAGRELNSFK